MGTITRFICTNADLKLTKDQINDIINELKTVPDNSDMDIRLFKDIKIEENQFEVIISALNFEMYGEKNGEIFRFHRIESESKWHTKDIIGFIKKIIIRYKGSLEGYFIADDGSSKESIRVINGNEIQNSDTETKQTNNIPNKKDQNILLQRININFQKITGIQINDFVSKLADSLPENVYLSVLDIGLKLNSKALIEKALRNHKSLYMKSMNKEERDFSVSYLSRMLFRTSDKHLLSYLRSNIELMGVSKDGVLVIELAAFYYKEKEYHSVEQCIILLDNIKNKQERDYLFGLYGLELLKQEEDVNSVKYITAFFDSILDWNNPEIHNKTWYILQELEKMDSILARSIILNTCQKIALSINNNESSEQWLGYLFRIYIKYNDYENMRIILARYERLLINVKQHQIYERRCWFLGYNLIPISNQQYKKYLENAIKSNKQANSPISSLDYNISNMLLLFANKNSLPEIDWLLQTISEIYNTSVDWLLGSKSSFQFIETKINYIIAELVIGKSNNSINKRALTNIKKLSPDLMIKLIEEIYRRHRYLLTKNVLLSVENKILEQTPKMNMDPLYEYICYSYCYLYRTEKESNYFKKVVMFQQKICSVDTRFYVSNEIINTLFEINETEKALQNEEEFYQTLVQLKERTVQQHYKLIIGRQKRCYQQTKKIRCLRLAIDAYNRLNNKEDRLDQINNIAELLIEHSKNVNPKGGI